MTKEELNSLSVALFKSEVLGVKLVDVVERNIDYSALQECDDIPKPIVVKLTIPEFSNITKEDLEMVFSNVTDEDVTNANINTHKIKVFKDSLVESWMKSGVPGMTEEDYFGSVQFLCRTLKGKEWTREDMKAVKEEYEHVIADIKKKIQEESEYMEV